MCDDDANEGDVKDEGEEEADEDDQVDGGLSLLHEVHPWQLAPTLIGWGGENMVQICTGGTGPNKVTGG